MYVCPFDNCSFSNMISVFCRYGLNMRHRVVEDKLLRQKAQLLLDEAASWSLLWYLFGKGNIFLAYHLYPLIKELYIYCSESLKM